MMVVSAIAFEVTYVSPTVEAAVHPHSFTYEAEATDGQRFIGALTLQPRLGRYSWWFEPAVRVDGVDEADRLEAVVTEVRRQSVDGRLQLRLPVRGQELYAELKPDELKTSDTLEVPLVPWNGEEPVGRVRFTCSRRGHSGWSLRRRLLEHFDDAQAADRAR